MAAPAAEQHPRYTHEILGRTAAWHFRDGRFEVRDFDTTCVDNAAISFRREDAELAFCVLVSAGASHLATVEGSPAERTIKVTVYYLHESFQEKWSTTQVTERGQPASGGLSWHESTKMHGGITEDGESVLLVYRPAGMPTMAFTVTKDGFTPRLPPSETAAGYLMSSGVVSDDSEHIFYTRRGDPFGSGGEAKAVEAFSLRDLGRLRAMTASFGDGRHMRNTRLLRPLRLREPVYIAVDTSDYIDGEYDRDAMLIASSDGTVQWHATGLRSITAVGDKANAAVSPDGKHMFFVQKDDALLQHWDLRRPTLQPIGSARLPGVEYSQSRRWIVHGRETTMRDAVAKKIDRIRYSPACSVVTVVTASASSTVINCFVASNLQLVYHQKFQHENWGGLVPLHVGFNESTGLAAVSMSPTLSYNHPNRGNVVVGASGVVFQSKDIFSKVKAIEDYFDSIGSRVAALTTSVETGGSNPICRYSWRPSVFDRNDATSLRHELGRAPITTAEDARRQREFYDTVFANPSSSVSMQSTPELRRFVMPHLFSFKYPWAQDKSVSIFGVMMKNEYHILAIGPSPSAPGRSPDVVRVLYASDIKVAGDMEERIEIYEADNNFILRVSRERGYDGAYSGAPMPLPRWTIASPHFLEEDAWYDLFVIHRAAHVTMPTGWSLTPNTALMETANIHAYFEPGTFAVMGVVDYGHRAGAVYVQPKYLLWQEYGLRGLRKPKANDIFFGGGRYADTLGHYFRSVYDDRTYDDSNPLFPSALALACNVAHRSRETERVDAFFRKLHRDDRLLLANTQSLSCTLPLACKARPMAALSTMRHIVLFPFKIGNIGIVEVRSGASRTVNEGPYYNGRQWQRISQLPKAIWRAVVPYQSASNDIPLEPNTSHVTLPLQGFCSFNKKLYEVPPVSSGRDSAFWEFIRATTPSGEGPFSRWERQILDWVASSGRRPASPFTRLVEEILDMKHRDVQLSFLRVPWLQKLLAWKLKKFSLRIYLTRTVLPILVLFIVHLAIGILLTESEDRGNGAPRVIIIVLACIEALVSCYILYTKARQIYRVPRLFFRSLPNYVDLIALSLGFALFIMVVSKHAPPRAFLGFSTLVIWIAAILMLRIYRPIGMLLLLLTETMQEVFSFLAFLSFVIVGFAFVPFLLLRNSDAYESGGSDPFSSFPLTISQMLNFIASDYGALEPYESDSAAVRTLKALYIIVITILFLNTLIAILNLKIKRADKNAENLYVLQAASLQVEIELGLLSSSERARRDWFPEWFSYAMTETEKRVWSEFLEKNPVKWTKENILGEDKDDAPVPPAPSEDAIASSQATRSAAAEASGSTATAAPSTPKPAAAPSTSKAAATASSKAALSSVSTTQQQSSPSAPPQPTRPTTRDNNNSSSADLLAAASGRADESRIPPPDSGTVDLLDVDDEEVGEDDDWWGRQAAGKNGEGSSHIANQAQPVATSAETAKIQVWPCSVCGLPGKQCLGCKTVAYCGKDHQKADWSRHKSECRGKGKA